MPAPIEKLCPVLLRPTSDGPELLVFRHPLAGVQLVKGTLEADETIATGALRELAEESGLTQAIVTSDLGSSLAIAPDQLWHFVRVEAGPLESRWLFDTADDGGHRFAFFWWPLAAEPGPDWHPIFVRALAHIRAALA
ncbi:NUDIX hydrolase [Devosia sp. A449]